MFATYADYSTNPNAAMNNMNLYAAGSVTMPELFFANHSAELSIEKEHECVIPTFTWINGTRNGNFKGLNFRRKVPRIFVNKEIKPKWRPSKLS